jgi:hypothetical protein
MTLQTTFGQRLLIGATDIAQTALDSCDVPVLADLAENQVLLAVDRVALTANNVTYAAAGHAFGYWKFFPAPDGFGIVPTWGFATVVTSRTPGINEGERFYGYWPLATHLLCNTADVSAGGFSDPSLHRQGLGPFYNRYLRTTTDPSYDAQTEDWQCLFRPLFTTAFLIERFLADASFFGGKQIVISSASSKTAFALAFLLAAHHRDKVKIIGLTSPSNRSFTTALGSYDEILSYDDVAKLRGDVPTVYVDFAGNADTRKTVHSVFGSQLKHSATIGVTHWTGLMSPPEPLPGPEPVLFFAPSVAEAQMKALGPAGFAKAFGAAWQQFLPHAKEHLQVTEYHGVAAARQQFVDLVAGKTAPKAGLILRLQD